MAEDRAKVKLGTSGGSIYTPGTPTMRAAGAMNADVATALRGAVAANPQMNYAAGAGQGIRQAYAEGGVPQAIGKTLAATAAAPYAIAKDTFSGVARDVGAFGSGVAKGMGFQVGDEGVTPPPSVAVPAPVASPQIQTASVHGGGIKSATQPQAPVEEGGGMIRDSQTGEVVRMDPAGNISRFDSTGAPISKLSPRQWGAGAQQAPAARGLTTTFADGTTEFTPASTEQAPPVWGLRPAAQEQAGAGGGYAPRKIETWGDWMTEKKERAAYGLNTQRMTAEAGAAKNLADAQQVAPEGASLRGHRAAQDELSRAQATNVPIQTEQLGEYYRGMVEASKDKNTAAAEAAKSATNAKIVQMDTGQVDALGTPIKGPAILNQDGTATPVTPAGLSSKITDLHASLDAKKKAQVAAKFGKRTNVDPMELHDFLRKLSSAEDK